MRTMAVKARESSYGETQLHKSERVMDGDKILQILALASGLGPLSLALSNMGGRQVFGYRLFLALDVSFASLLLPVGCSNFCLSCSHGGHAKHMLDWFSKYSVCPAGCGCRCLEASGWT